MSQGAETSDLIQPLTPAQLLARLAIASGPGSTTTVNADLLRGREYPGYIMPTFPVYFAPPFMTPPTYGDVLSQYTFGR